MRSLQVIFAGYVSSEKFNKYSGDISGRFPFIIFLGGRAYNFAGAVYVYGCTPCFILTAPCNIVFVHFKSAPPRNTLFSGGKACVDTTVPGNLLFDVSVYSLHQFINWDFVAS